MVCLLNAYFFFYKFCVTVNFYSPLPILALGSLLCCILISRPLVTMISHMSHLYYTLVILMQDMLASTCKPKAFLYPVQVIGNSPA